MSAKSDRVERQAERLRMAIRARRSIVDADPAIAETGRVRLEEAARLASVTAHWGIATDIPIVTRAVVFWRRVMRLTLRWYVNPIVEQQNAYNQSVLSALRDLRAENDALHEQLARLRERIASDEAETA